MSNGDDGPCRAETFDDAERAENYREEDGDRQQDTDDSPHQIDPEVAQLGGLAACDTAAERDGNRHSHGRAGEGLDTQSGRHADVAQRGLSGVVLPAGVGDEADRRIEREQRRHSFMAPRLWKVGLANQKRQEAEHTDRGECQHRRQVPNPALLTIGIHPGNSVDESFNLPMVFVYTWAMWLPSGTCSAPRIATTTSSCSHAVVSQCIAIAFVSLPAAYRSLRAPCKDLTAAYCQTRSVAV